MTKDDEHGPEAVVERLAAFLWNPIDGSGITDEDRTLARDALNHALQPGDILPNGLEVCQGWRPIKTAPKDSTHIQIGEYQEGEDGFHAITAFYWKGEWLRFPGEGAVFPSHWRPLPPPPRPAKERCRE